MGSSGDLTAGARAFRQRVRSSTHEEGAGLMPPPNGRCRCPAVQVPLPSYIGLVPRAPKLLGSSLPLATTA